MRVLAVGAHPDDVEIWCGGTLARFAGKGDEVFMAYGTDGQVGSTVFPPEEIAEIRKHEAQEACRVIGAEMCWLGVRDQFFFYNEETRMLLLNLMRRVKPDVVITHFFPDPSSPDHENLGRNVNHTSILITVPNIKTEFAAGEFIPPVYLMEPPLGVEFFPEEFVDITDVIDIKKEMVSKHKSQEAWLKEQYGITYVEYIETIARFRGIQSGVRYAEGFKRVKKGFSPDVARRVLP